jgi:hypothetical protein
MSITVLRNSPLYCFEAEDVMRYIQRLLILLALCAATLAAAESPTIEFAPHSERFSLSKTLAVISAINRLGSDNYDVREAASQSLRDIGRGARKLLEAGSRLPDLEISKRCRMLLHEADIMTALFNLRSENEKVRVAAFQILHKEGKAVREPVELSLQSGNTESQFLCRELLRLMQYDDSYGTVFSKDVVGGVHQTHFNPDTTWAPSD